MSIFERIHEKTFGHRLFFPPFSWVLKNSLRSTQWNQSLSLSFALTTTRVGTHLIYLPCRLLNTQEHPLGSSVALGLALCWDAAAGVFICDFLCPKDRLKCLSLQFQLGFSFQKTPACHQICYFRVSWGPPMYTVLYMSYRPNTPRNPGNIRVLENVSKQTCSVCNN